MKECDEGEKDKEKSQEGKSSMTKRERKDRIKKREWRTG